MHSFVKLAATGALALLVNATPALASPSPATAASAMPHYCIYYAEGGIDCSFVSLAQCQATASGTDAYCGLNPRFAYGWQPQRRHPHQG